MAHRAIQRPPLQNLKIGQYCESCTVLIGKGHQQTAPVCYRSFMVCQFCCDTLIKEAETAHRQFVRSLNDALNVELSPPITVTLTAEDELEYKIWRRNIRKQKGQIIYDQLFHEGTIQRRGDLP